MALAKGIYKFFEKVSKKRKLNDQLKTCENRKKMREGKGSTGSLTGRPDDVFAESLESPERIEIIFNCLRECLHETRNEISTHHKRNSVYITFHYGPFSKSQ